MRASAPRGSSATILAGGRYATREAKRLVLDRPAVAGTARIAATRRSSAEGQDGLRAFLGRRSPGWLASD